MQKRFQGRGQDQWAHMRLENYGHYIHETHIKKHRVHAYIHTGTNVYINVSQQRSHITSSGYNH